MRNNTAAQAGNSIYLGTLNSCSDDLWKTFHITEKNISSAVCSAPYKVCICNTDFPMNHHCSHQHNISVFPGKYFNVSVVGVGSYNNSSPAILIAKLIGVENKTLRLKELTKTQQTELECRNISYLLSGTKTNKTIDMQISIQNKYDKIQKH